MFSQPWPNHITAELEGLLERWLQATREEGPLPGRDWTGARLERDTSCLSCSN